MASCPMTNFHRKVALGMKWHIYYTNHAEWIVSESPCLGFPTGVNDLKKTEFTVPGEGGLPDIQKLDTKYLQSSVFCNLRFTHF